MRTHVVAAAVVLAATAGLARADSLAPVSVTAGPRGEGSSARPQPKRLAVDLTVAGPEGQRPAVLRQVTAEVEGLVAFERAFPRCRLAQAEEPELVDVLAKCRRAQIGSGRVLTLMGLSHDRSDQAPCDLDVRVFNLGARRIALRLDRREEQDCLVDPEAAITARLRRVRVRGRLTERISFVVPEDLRHPIPGIEVAVTRVQVTISRAARRTRVGRRMRPVGFVSAVGCAKGRVTRVTTLDEAGARLRHAGRTRC